MNSLTALPPDEDFTKIVPQLLKLDISREFGYNSESKIESNTI